MESTGVFWIPLFQIHVKNVPVPKTDVEDCQWLQHLHCGQPSARVIPARMKRSVCGILSWLRLCPELRISGGQIRAALGLRLAAPTLHRSQNILGDYFRRMKSARRCASAITAVAHKLARIVYHLIAISRNSPPPFFRNRNAELRTASAEVVGASARAGERREFISIDQGAAR